MTSPACTLSSFTTAGEHGLDRRLPGLQQGERGGAGARDGAVEGQEDVGPERRGSPVALVEGHPRDGFAVVRSSRTRSQPAGQQRGLPEPGWRGDQRDRRVRTALQQLGQARSRHDLATRPGQEQLGLHQRVGHARSPPGRRTRHERRARPGPGPGPRSGRGARRTGITLPLTTCGDARSPHRCLASRPIEQHPPLCERHDHGQVHPRHRHGQREAPVAHHHELGRSSWAPSSSSPPAAAARSPTTSPRQGSQSDRAMQLLDRELPRGGQGHGPGRLRRPRTARRSHEPARAASTAVLTDVAGARPRRVGRRPVRGRHRSRRTAGSGTPCSTLDVPEREMGKPAFAVLSDARVQHRRRRRPGRARRRRRRSSTPRTRAPATSASASWSRCSSCSSSFGTVVGRHAPDRPRRSSRSAPASAASPCWPAPWTSRPSAIPVAGLVGLGVGIDYALFVVARYRENRAAGQDNQPRPRPTRWAPPAPPSSSPAAPSSSPRPRSPSPALGVLTSIGLATALMVLFAVAAAITLLPALLGLLGDRIDTGRLVRRHRPAKRAEDTAWWRFGHRVSGRPWPYLLGAVVALLALAAPALRDADRLPGRRRRPGRDHAPAGLRPARRGLRRRDQRAAAGRRRPATPPASTPPASPALAERHRRRPGHRLGRASRRPPRTAAPWSSPPCRPPARPTPRPPPTIDRVRDVIPGNVYVSGHHRDHRRPQRPARRHAAALHRRRDRGVVPAADAGLPLGRGPAEGGR